jgi:hypothetical protein
VSRAAGLRRRDECWLTIGVVKHLGKDDVGSSVDLLAEVVHLHLGRFALRVSLWKASDLHVAQISFPPLLSSFRRTPDLLQCQNNRHSPS